MAETWLTSQEIGMYQIPEYTAILQPRMGRRSGGIVVFIRNSCTYTSRCFSSTSNESILLHISARQQFKILCTYRNCRSPITDYLDFLSELLSSDHNSFDLLMGDINQDILPNNDLSNESLRYMDFMASKGFVSHVSGPTRVSETSNTAIDHCFLRNQVLDIRVDNFDVGISDHHCLAIKLCNFPIKKKKETYCFCDMRLVKTALKMEHWTDILNIDNVDQVYEGIVEKIHNAQSSATETVIITNKNRRRNEWMNQGLITKCTQKNKLHARAKKFPFNRNLQKELKDMQLTLKKELKQAKSVYFKQKFDEADTTQKFWKIANSIIRGKKSDNIIDNINIDGNPTPVKGNELLVANHFNAHFSTIAEKLINDNNFNSMPNPPIPEPDCIMWFPRITLQEVEKAIDKMKNKKKCRSGWYIQ